MRTIDAASLTPIIVSSDRRDLSRKKSTRRLLTRPVRPCSARVLEAIIDRVPRNAACFDFARRTPFSPPSDVSSALFFLYRRKSQEIAGGSRGDRDTSGLCLVDFGSVVQFVKVYCLKFGSEESDNWICVTLSTVSFVDHHNWMRFSILCLMSRVKLRQRIPGVVH
jgi:hypothetical protein